MRIYFVIILLLFSLWVISKRAQASPPEGTVFFEAESMENDGVTWKEKDYTPSAWYSDVPSNLKILDGGANNPGNGESTKDENIENAGTYKIWVRYSDYLDYRGPFKITVFQGGNNVGEKTFDTASLRATDEGKQKWGSGYGQLVWDNLELTLGAGQVHVVLSRVDPVGGWMVRSIDCFAISNDLSYEPSVRDFIEPLYVKVKMGSTHPEPSIVRLVGSGDGLMKCNFGKQVFAYWADLAGSSPSNYLAIGEESPWLDLVPALALYGDNKLAFSATKNISNNLVSLENSDFNIFFASAPSDDAIFKTASRSGNGAYLNVILDINARGEIKSDVEFSTEARQAAEALETYPNGKRAEKFPIMTDFFVTSPQSLSSITLDNEISVLKKLGFNGIGGKFDQVFLDNDFNKPSDALYVKQYRADNKCYNQPKTAEMRSALEQEAERIIDSGLDSELTYFKLWDEPGAPDFAEFVTQSCYQQAFVSYLQEKGVELADLGKSDWDEVVLTADKTDEPELFYETALFRQQIISDFFKLATDILEEKMSSIKTTANYTEELTDSGNALERGIDWFLLHKDKALTYGLTEEWFWGGVLSNQLVGYRSDFLRSAGKYHNQEFGMYITKKDARNMSVKAAAEIGHGAKSIHFYEYGPHYAAGAHDEWSHLYERYSGVRDPAYAIGGAEDYIVSSSVPRSKIAMLYSPTTDIWTLDDEYSLFGKERMYLYLLLRHLGYPIDIITEDDISEGRLNDYELLIAEGSHFREEIAAPLASWVKSGGFLYLGAGSGMFNQYNQPLDLESELGFSREEFTKTGAVQDESLRTAAKKDTISFQSENLDAIYTTQKAESWPDGAEVLARFSNDDPAVLLWNLDQGKVIFSGFFPGAGYAKSGAQSKYDADSSNPPSYDEGYRLLFSRILQSLSYKPIAETDNYLVEANMLESSKGLLITLSNWGEDDADNLTVKIRPKRPFRQPEAQKEEIESVQWSGNELNIKLDVDDFDFIVLPNSQYRSDLNADSSVNTSDFDILKADFLRSTAGLQNIFSDINQDGQATIRDAGIMMGEWK